MIAQEVRERPRQMLREPGRIGKQMDAGAHSGSKPGEIAPHCLHIVNDEAGVIEQAFAGCREFDTTADALEQADAERLLQPLDALAGGGQSKMRAVGAVGNGAAIRHCDEELQVDEIETHGPLLPSKKTKAVSVTSRLWQR